MAHKAITGAACVVVGSFIAHEADATWSIAAMDSVTGDVGVAAASCVPGLHADGLASLVPGVGVAVTQASWTVENHRRVFAALSDGVAAEEVLARAIDSDIDADVELRQYGVITLTDAGIRSAGFTGSNVPDVSDIRVDADMAVTVQGNTLENEAVVSDALVAFLTDDADGRNALPDRLMRALEAGSAAGGDWRCNQDGRMTTAATAFILVARGSDEAYAARTIGISDQGTDRAPWLAISEAEPIEGPNPLIELRRRYDRWRSENNNP